MAGNLSELRDLSSIHQCSCRSSGMKIFRSLAIESQTFMGECVQQTLHVSLEATEGLRCGGVLAFAYIQYATRRQGCLSRRERRAQAPARWFSACPLLHFINAAHLKEAHIF